MSSFPSSPIYSVKKLKVHSPYCSPQKELEQSAENTTIAYKTNGLIKCHIFSLVLIPFVTCIPEEEGQGHYDQGSHYGQQDNQTTVKFHLAPAEFFQSH